FFSACFGSSFGFSATGLGGSGFFSTGFSTGCGGGSGEVEVTTSRLSILPMASSTGLASATFSTNGVFFSLSPFLMPAVILASWSDEMMSTGRDSGVTSSERALKEINPHPITRTWRTADATRVLSTFTEALSLIHFRHQSHAAKTGGRKPSHHLHHSP